jgi:hypothetical protein
MSIDTKYQIERLQLTRFDVQFKFSFTTFALCKVS